MREHGYECIEGDIGQLAIRDNAVRFVTMSHLLEHLPDVKTVERVVAMAARVAQDFLFIQGPWFDADDYLAERGLKFYWSDWHGHKCHVSTGVLREALAKVGLDDYALMARAPVLDSSDAAIHPLAAERDQHDYDPEQHPPKPDVAFDIPVYREMVCLVRLPGFRRSRFWQRTVLPSWEELLKVRPGCQVLPDAPMLGKEATLEH